VVSVPLSGHALLGGVDTGHSHAVGCGWQIAGARVGELQNFGTPQVGTDGKPVKPHLKTLNVNLVGAMYSTYSSTPMSAVPQTLGVHAHHSHTASVALPTKNMESMRRTAQVHCISRVFGYVQPYLPRALRCCSTVVMTTPESAVDHTPKSRDLCHLSAWVTRLLEINATASHTQRDPHRNGANHISPG